MRNIRYNTENKQTKIVNIKSELLFREAEDDFYYFNKPLRALKKLKTALELTPGHLKSLVLSGDILFCRGNIKKALEYYSIADAVSSPNTKIYASIANCFKMLGNNEQAITFFNKASEIDDGQNPALTVQILEMKAQSAIASKYYTEAKNALSKLKNLAYNTDLSDYLLYDYFLLYNKLKIHNKIKNYELRVI